ncbi:hypothetical protein P153DRAFT_400337 [Dothidotthia symphoricarpi CBS 119687]|uniref:Uncharacterized protein n=1 Tax=Dothidotthia symphoricarpi CBS 119687 TaxID=1392245 RepID=A0A6A6A4K5_9PLEO|nr:uncharacterized protein P153DRAFT_400337 [Dothidotthia symphoricarpi CBS 119687]KAF2125531.1 hypothetical protein P153DRAFT_400337 [Dothidotthia symphoricarpi CBS 119687]
MSSLTSQESSETQPQNPINSGSTDKKSDAPAKGTSTSSSGGAGEKELGGEDFKKTGGGSALEGVEESVQERGEAERGRAV